MANSDPRCLLASDAQLNLPQDVSATIPVSASQPQIPQIPLPQDQPVFHPSNSQQLNCASQPSDDPMETEPIDPADSPPSSPPPNQPANEGLWIAIPPVDEVQKELGSPGSFTAVPDAASDLCADETLSALEKMYVFSNSGASFHRAYIARSISSYLPQVTAGEAVEYVLPLMGGLAMDEDERVKEALIEDLAESIWWFLTNCQIVEDEPSEAAINQDPPLLSVQAFTPLLGTLLLNPNSAVGTPARYVVTNLLDRMWNAMENDLTIGYFGAEERRIFRSELVHQIVIGLGHLDTPVEQMDAPMAAQNLTSSLSPMPMPFSMEAIPDDEDGLGSPSAALVEQMNMAQLSPIEATASPFSPTSASIPISDPEFVSPSRPLSPLSVKPPPISLPEQVLSHPTDANLSPSGVSPPLHISHDPIGDIPTTSYRALADEHISGGLLGAEQTDADLDNASANDQGAIGRLASMSLMAAVTANSMLTTQSREAFVREVKRVSTDPVYWVRREATFALGALAKIVPEEVVIGSLLPMFESFCQDSVSHVRQSVLFALPAVLSRLPSKQKREQTLRTIMKLSRDPSTAVRSGVLEVLGEVIYAFHDDESGPPDEIAKLFIGEEGVDWYLPTDSLLKGQQTNPVGSEDRPHPDKLIEFYVKQPDPPPQNNMVDLTTALIRAFNFPAVALTLGSSRWSELRRLYAYLANHRAPKVRRTLAASIGEIAKIIGPEHAREDLMDVWWNLTSCSDEAVRSKALECMVMFVQSLDLPDRRRIIGSLENIWTAQICGWREREICSRKLGALAPLVPDSGGVLCALLKRALYDSMAAVRDAGVASYPQIISAFDNRPDHIQLFRQEVLHLAQAESFRQRVTYLKCQQAVMLSDDLYDAIADEELRRTLMILSKDKIVDVRVGVARLVGTICVHAVHMYRTIPEDIAEMIERLSQDSSYDVRSFVSPYLKYPDFSMPEAAQKTPTMSYDAIFSRPPPPALSVLGENAQDEGMDDIFEFRDPSTMDLSSLDSLTGSPQSLASSFDSSAIDTRSGDSGSATDSDISIPVHDCEHKDDVDVSLYASHAKVCERNSYGSESSSSLHSVHI